MPIAEPMTVFTDYVLAAVAVALALSLERRAEGHLSRRLWAACFVAVAIAAVAGGTWHGWGPRMGEGPRAALWLVTYALVGLGNSLILTGAAVAATRGAVRIALTLAFVLRFAIGFASLAARPDFRYVVYDYAGTLVGLLVFAAWLARHRRPGASWIVAGVLASLGGALVQRGGRGPSPSFNHNDLFHVIQAVGLYLYFRGGRLLADARARAAESRA